jgi:transaldolase
MRATQLLHNLGQSLWLDNITRDLVNSGTLKRYIDELSVTGLTSNPTIFDHAIKNSSSYDAAIREGLGDGKSGEELFFELALEDLRRAADLFRPVFDRTNGVDGWVSLEVSPLLAHDTASTLAAAKSLHTRAGRPNLLIKIPGTKEGLPAIEESVSPVCRSMSRYYFHASTTSQQPRPICAGSSDASMPDFNPISGPWLRSSLAVGTQPSEARYRRR